MLAAPAGAAAADRFVDHDTGVDAGACLSSASPCQSIGYTLFASSPGDTVKVDDDLTFDNPAFMLDGGRSVEGAEFVGGDEGDVVIDGAGNVAVDVPASTTAGTISGLTIRNVNVGVRLSSPTVAVDGNTFDGGGSGQAEIVVTAGSPTISDNELTDDSTLGTDADNGIVVTGASATISGNRISDYRQGILAQLGSSGVVIDGNEITGTHTAFGNGDGIAVDASSATIRDNLLTDPATINQNGIRVNRGSGTASAVLRRNQVYGYGTGVSFAETASASMNGDVVGGSLNEGLVAFDGGAGGGDVSATNVTIVSAGSATRDLLVSSATLTLESSIIGDEGTDISLTSGSCVITRSRGPSTSGPDNGCDDFDLTDSPAFVNAANDDYHLLPVPANDDFIDDGDPAAPSAPDDVDLDGQKRAMDSDSNCTEVREIGADELNPGLQGQPDIDSGPGEGSTTADSTPTFGFSSAYTCTSTFECKVDLAPFAPCSSPTTLGVLSDGPHQFQVRVVDLVPQSGVEQTRNFTVADPPETTITAGPKAKLTIKKGKTAKASFSFGSDEPGSFQCALDGGSFAACSSPRVLKLKPGSHTFRVRATDSAGNQDASPATRTTKVVKKKAKRKGR